MAVLNLRAITPAVPSCVSMHKLVAQNIKATEQNPQDFSCILIFKRRIDLAALLTTT